jgi:hypothetical protein
MSKLDVGVGEEFPTEETKRVEHHHHYYHYPRRPGRLLRIILAIVLIGALFRAMHFAFDPFAWEPRGYWPNPFFPFGGLLSLILVVGLLLWFVRDRNRD